MKRRGMKLAGITLVAIFTGLFMQFSVPDKTIQEKSFKIPVEPPPFLQESSDWADSVLAQMSLQEKVAQLIMVASYPKEGEAGKNKITHLIEKHNIGGVIMFHGHPQKVFELTQHFQSISDCPLLIATDGEWGLSMRIKPSIIYPRQMTLGAIQDEHLIYQMGRDIGQQLKQLGIHVNFAPVIDVNNNANNPVINNRSFGELRENVTRKGYLYMKGMQDVGVIAVAKHFPGHGDTEVDSHHGLPVISHNRPRLDSLELYPFQQLINGGLGGVMLAHMNVTALDSTPNLASSLSPLIGDTLLQDEIGFQGLVFTDAMNMKGVSKYFTPTEANLRAIMAGNDIVLMPAEVEKTIQYVVRSVRRGKIDIELIDQKCLKILQAKDWIQQRSPQPQTFSIDSLQKPKHLLTRKQIIASSITVPSNNEEFLPIKRLDTLKIASVAIGNAKGDQFQQTLKLYTQVDAFNISNNSSASHINKVHQALEDYNLVILSLHSEDSRAQKKYGVPRKLSELADSLATQYPSILVAFSNPYLLNHLSCLDSNLSVICSYQNDSITQSLSAQLVFGGIGTNARMPVSIDGFVKAGTGYDLRPINRLSYVSPFEAGMDQSVLYKIDSLALDAISEKATPGCQVLIAKGGKVFYNKSFGHHTYSKHIKVKNSDIYDLASLTKITASLPALMALDAAGQIDVNAPLSQYLPELDTTNKKGSTIRDILLHQAGFTAWIPFYQNTIEPVYPKQELSSNKYSKRYPIQIGPGFYMNKHIKYKHQLFDSKLTDSTHLKVAEALYLRDDYADSIKYRIFSSEVDKPGKYRYSDLGFYLFYWMFEEMFEKGFENYLDSAFYSPLGCTSLGYNPLARFEKSRIIPTENDLVFRKQILRGYVHDPGAAMLGGVCGHAGLFANANDLAKIMQMYLNGGSFGGQKYLDADMIDHYTDCIECKNGNRRGLGFDKPHPDTTKSSPAFHGVPHASYGHTGFTGTMAWMDPDNEILYIFLSNRIYPDANNKKLIQMDVRTNIQAVIYESLLR